MKKIILPFLIMLLISEAVLADEDVLRPKGKPDGYYENVEDDYVFKRSPLALGFEVGGNYNMFSQDMTYDPLLDDPVTRSLSEGTGISPYFGVFGDFSFNETFGLHLKLQYSMISYSNDQKGLIDGVLYENGTPVEVRLTESELEWDNNFAMFQIEPSLRINFTPEFFGLIGFVAQIPISDISGEVTQRTLEDGFYLQDQQGNQVTSLTSDIEGDVEDLNNRFGLNLSLGYKLAIAENISIVPQLHFQYFATNIADDQESQDVTQANTNGISTVNSTDTKLNHIRLSVALWFDL